MLNKKYCIKCWKKSGYKWIEDDDEWWKKEGKIHCPIEYKEEGKWIAMNIRGKPPNKCPFLLEHTISNED